MTHSLATDIDLDLDLSKGVEKHPVILDVDLEDELFHKFIQIPLKMALLLHNSSRGIFCPISQFFKVSRTSVLHVSHRNVTPNVMPLPGLHVVVSFSILTRQRCFKVNVVDIINYVKTNVPGPGCDRELLLEQYQGCTCREECSIETCSCFQIFGSAYGKRGRLLESFTTEPMSKPILECGDDCNCDRRRCVNRVVQKGANGKFCVFYCKEKGFGLKTLEALEKLSFVCEYAGEIVSKEEAKKRLQHTDRTGTSNYLISINERTSAGDLRTYVDPQHIGNLGRFINHSCDPNLVMLPVRVNHSIPRLALFCRRDVKAGEEMTFDYSGRSTFNMNSQNKCNECLADSSTCGQFAETKRDQCEFSLRRNVEKIKDENSQVDEEKQHIQHSVLDAQSSCLKTKNCGSVLKRNLICDDKMASPSKKTAVPCDSKLNKIRKQCLCGSENCVRFLPFNAI